MQMTESIRQQEEKEELISLLDEAAEIIEAYYAGENNLSNKLRRKVLELELGVIV